MYSSCLYKITGLKVLPPLPPESRLKNLNASKCGLESIDSSFIQIGTSFDLSYNQIKELPKGETIQFIEAGGKLGKALGTSGSNAENEANINLDFNPLIYPPYYIYMQGEGEVYKFLELFSPSEMYLPKDFSVMLVGDSMEGKSSLGRTLEKGEPQALDVESASDDVYGKIGEEDRTEAFDVYEWKMDDCVVYVTDIGGQDDYNLMLPLLCRDYGLFLLILSCSFI